MATGPAGRRKIYLSQSVVAGMLSASPRSPRIKCDVPSNIGSSVAQMLVSAVSPAHAEMTERAGRSAAVRNAFSSVIRRVKLRPSMPFDSPMCLSRHSCVDQMQAATLSARRRSAHAQKIPEVHFTLIVAAFGALPPPTSLLYVNGCTSST